MDLIQYVPKIMDCLERLPGAESQDVTDYQNLKDMRSAAIQKAKDSMDRAMVSMRFLKLANYTQNLATKIREENLALLGSSAVSEQVQILVAVVTQEMKVMNKPYIPRSEVWASVRELCHVLKWNNIKKSYFLRAMLESGHQCQKIRGTHVYKLSRNTLQSIPDDTRLLTK